MLSRTLNQIDQSPWGKLVWAGVAVLALVQVVAFHRLCASQVARAQARETVAVEQRNTLTNCLDYTRRSTISSCARIAVGRDAEAGSLVARDLPSRLRSSQPLMSSVVPVSYVYH